MKINQSSKAWYYTIATVKACAVGTREHGKDATVTRRGYANDSVSVTCECGGEWKALTYAK